MSLEQEIGFFECDKPSLPHKRDRFGFLVNSDLVDSFTPMHILSGWVLGRIGVNPTVIFAIGVAWDYGIERKVKCSHPHLFPHPSQDEPMHVAADFALYGVGAYFGRKAYLKGRGA